MRTMIDRIEAGRLLPQGVLRRLGLSPRRIVRVILETVDEDGEISISEMNAQGGAARILPTSPPYIPIPISSSAMKISFGDVPLARFPSTDLMGDRPRPH